MNRKAFLLGKLDTRLEEMERKIKLLDLPEDVKEDMLSTISEMQEISNSVFSLL